MTEPSSAPTVSRKWWWRGIRPRLIAVLLIPMVAALVLGALRVETAVTASNEASRAESLANALPDSFRLAIRLTVERDSANVGISGTHREGILVATDQAIDTWRTNAGEIDSSEDRALRDDLREARRWLNDIDDLRKQIADPETQAAAVDTYTDMVNVLLGLSARLPALGDPSIYAQADALAEVRTASEVLGAERVVVGQALMQGEISASGLMQLAGAQSLWDRASEEFIAGTSPAAREQFETLTDRGATGSLTPLHVMDRVIADGDMSGVDLTIPEWMSTYSDFVQKMEDVIVQAASDLSADVADTRQSAQQTALLTSLVVVLVLLAALAVTILAARSILQPLVRLRRAALEIAGETLPERVRQIDAADGPVDTSVEPVDVRRRDEIGEVAEAFDAIHAEAVRLAGEQARMRANVNRMFVNLSRRSQNLVERQLRLIDQLEAGEQDPAQLANLFQLDNLATRMRRNDESLLVLAGGDTGQATRGDVPVIDVLRAATSEIEQFARVEVDSAEVSELRGAVAGDLVHLLAELLENATSFSPPETPVVVQTLPRQPRAPLVVVVKDLGIGMTPDELLAANAKLRSTGALDADVARMMGLVVTARLADRHGMSVVLRMNDPRGVVARVEIPPQALAESRTKPLPVAAAQSADVPAQTAALPAPAAAVAAPAAAVPAAAAPAAAVPAEAAAAVPAEPAPAVHAAPPSAPTLAVDERGLVPEQDGDGGETPIFAAMQSAWFSRRTPLATRREVEPQADAGQRAEVSRRAAVPETPQTWSSPGDDGWARVAEVTQRPQEPELVTAGGLPKRVPGQNLVPGAAPSTAQPVPPPQRSVDQRRSALSSFQRGVSRARGDSAPEPTTDQLRSERWDDQ